MTDVVGTHLIDGGVDHQRALIDAITESAAEGLYAIDTLGRLTFMNRAAERMLGWSRAELLGRSAHEVIHHSHADGRRMAADTCPVVAVMRTGQPVRVEDDVFFRRDGTPLDVSYTSAPIRIENQVAGAVVAFHDITERRRTERALRDEAQIIETLHFIGAALAAELDLHRLLQLVTDAATAVTGAQFGSFFYNMEGETGSYLLYTLSGAPAEAFAHMPMPRATKIFEPTFRGEAVVRLADVTTDPRYGRNPPYSGMPEGHLPVRSYLAVPVRSLTGKVLGGLFFGHEDVGVFDERDERLVIGIAAQAAVAIDNARLFEEAQEEIRLRARAEAEQRFVAEVSTVLASSLDYAGTADQVAHLVVPFLADSCVVELAEDPTYRPVAVVHRDPEAEALLKEWHRVAPPHRDGEDPVHAVAMSGQSRLVTGIVGERRTALARDQRHLDLLDRLDVRTALIVPLTVGGRAVGTMSFAICRSDRVFSHHDVALAEEIARRVAVAIDNARLFEERTAVARALQESLLPPLLPEIAGVNAAARYRAAGAGNLVGGDFYDVFRDGDGNWAFVLGDVCGFGPEAAAITGIARYTIRAVTLTETQPSRVLGALNQAIVRQRDDERFCTAVYLRLRPGDPVRVSFAAGGHPPPLLLRTDGTTEFVSPAAGGLLGAFEQMTFTDHDIDLHHGDSFVLYTDGVIEARSRGGELFGAERLLDLVSACRNRSAQGIASRIEAGLQEFAPGQLTDDMALLVIQARDQATSTTRPARKQDR